MGFLLSVFFGYVPMLVFALFAYWLDRYEKEPAVLLGVIFHWGAIIAAGAAFIANTLLGVGVYLFTSSEVAANFATGSIIAPVVEETLKGAAVLLVFLFLRNEFDSVLDGITYAAVTALGFAATENIFYIYSLGFLESGYSGLFSMVLIRVILVGWQHPFFTAFLGIGLAMARLTKTAPLKFVYPLAGWMLAIFTHSFHNTIASLFTTRGGFILGSVLDWAGWLLMFAFILYVLSKEQQSLRRYLQEEVELGTITPNQYLTACSGTARTSAQLRAIGTSQYRNTGKLYQLCGELVHKKHQHASFGNENGNIETVQQLRTKIKQLSEQIPS